jgi:outer membrane cobalamin receptor
MTKPHHWKTAALLTALSASTALPSAALAQTVADEIIVTGERIGAGEVRATSVVTSADILNRPLGADITQVLNRVPGVVTTTGDARGGSFSFEFYLRGLNKEQVGFTLDGIPSGDARFNGGSPPQRFIEPSNVGKIKVSQSAGDIGAPSRFALGGFVDFMTADPASTLGATFEAGYGSYDFWRGYGRIDTGEIAEGLSAYASYSHQENDIWAGRNSRSSRRDHIEGKIVKTWTDGSFLKARVAWNDQRDNDFNIVTLPEFRADKHSDRATDALTGLPGTDVDFGGALGGKRRDVMAYLNGRVMLTSTIQLDVNPYYQTLRGESYRYQDRARQLAGNDPYAVIGYNANGGAIRPALTTLRNNVLGGPVDLRVTPRDRDRYGATAEIKATDLIQGHTVRVGAWWEGGKSSEERRYFRLTQPGQSLAYDATRINYAEYKRSTRIETTMLYGQDSIELLPDLLRLDAGLTWLNVHYKARSPLEYSAAVDFSQHSKINPKIGASLTPAPRVEIFGGYAKNFAGISEDAFLGSTAVITPRTLDPIQSENIDLGIRYTARHWAVSVQGYSVDLKNNIGIVPNDPTVVDVGEIIRGNVATRAANIEGQKTRGVEVTGLADFGIVDLYASYSYQHARHDDPAVGSAARKALASVAVIGGAAVRDIPTNSAYGEIGLKPVAGLRLQGNVRYVGRRVGGHIVAPTTFAEIGVEKIPGYTLAGANASYTFGDLGPLRGLRLQLNVDNLFDKAYIGAVSSSTATQPEFGLPGRTLDRYFLGAPRTWTLSVQTKF